MWEIMWSQSERYRDRGKRAREGGERYGVIDREREGERGEREGGRSEREGGGRERAFTPFPEDPVPLPC